MDLVPAGVRGGAFCPAGKRVQGSPEERWVRRPGENLVSRPVSSKHTQAFQPQRLRPGHPDVTPSQGATPPGQRHSTQATAR